MDSSCQGTDPTSETKYSTNVALIEFAELPPLIDCAFNILEKQFISGSIWSL